MSTMQNLCYDSDFYHEPLLTFWHKHQQFYHNQRKNAMNTHTLPIIAYHRSPLSQKFGIPRQPNLVAVKSCIEFVPPYDQPEAFVGIENYSHLWVIWQFHKNKHQDKERASFRPQVRPPRLGGNDKMGVFATRSMYRPSALGLSVVELDCVSVVDGRVVLHIVGADMADGTPIVDVKPYLPFVDGVVGATGFDKPTVRTVSVNKKAEQKFHQLLQDDFVIQEDWHIISELIAQDPRPAYRQNEINVVCAMRYKSVDVDFFMNDDGVLVIADFREIF